MKIHLGFIFKKRFRKTCLLHLGTLLLHPHFRGDVGGTAKQINPEKNNKNFFPERFGTLK
ncbi:hypothetical protein [Massilibacteroides vaginae]|uniref:hypothetical protein n=1 Tax=Massilibacteroides vaginae TaxID=1673718 RepID=UPI000A1C8CA1|nr:hypothetical protein [Massilibacteroides vaginae]